MTAVSLVSEALPLTSLYKVQRNGKSVHKGDLILFPATPADLFPYGSHDSVEGLLQWLEGTSRCSRYVVELLIRMMDPCMHHGMSAIVVSPRLLACLIELLGTGAKSIQELTESDLRNMGDPRHRLVKPFEVVSKFLTLMLEFASVPEILAFARLGDPEVMISLRRFVVANCSLEEAGTYKEMLGSITRMRGSVLDRLASARSLRRL